MSEQGVIIIIIIIIASLCFFLATDYTVFKLQGGSPSPTDMMKDLAVSNQEKQDLEHLITTLESDNRFATK